MLFQSSLDIIPALLAQGATVKAFDPEGHEARAMLQGVTFASGPYEAAEGADLLLILTEWDQFRALDLARIKTLMKTPVIADLRNVYKPEEMRDSGFRYISIGRAPVGPAA